MKSKEISEETIKRKHRQDLRNHAMTTISTAISELQEKLAILKIQEKCKHMTWSRSRKETSTLRSRCCQQCSFVHYYLISEEE